MICPVINFSRSLFRALADKFVSQTMENGDVSSVKSLGFDNNSFDKSLMCIKNNNGPKIEPYVTPSLTAAHLKTCPFKTTLWYLFVKKSSMIFNKFPDISLSLNISDKPSGHLCQKFLICWEKHLLLPNHHQMTLNFISNW